jgi:hypothetical protein
VTARYHSQVAAFGGTAPTAATSRSSKYRRLSPIGRIPSNCSSLQKQSPAKRISSFVVRTCPARTLTLLIPRPRHILCVRLARLRRRAPALRTCYKMASLQNTSFQLTPPPRHGKGAGLGKRGSVPKLLIFDSTAIVAAPFVRVTGSSVWSQQNCRFITEHPMLRLGFPSSHLFDRGSN